MGDPAGIGPEIIVRAWSDPRLHAIADLLVSGHAEPLGRTIELVGSEAQLVEVADPDEEQSSPECIPMMTACDLASACAMPGVVSRQGGTAAYDALRLAIDLSLERRVDAIATAPLSKSALHRAGHDFPGHTEILADAFGMHDFAMMLYLRSSPALAGPAGLAVTHATLHTPLADVPAQLEGDGLVKKLVMTRDTLAPLRGAEPRLAVCALNPHAGEDGIFGAEERETIRPAVERGQRLGLDVEGPFAADSLMVRARDGEFDAVLAMYHDQGHVPLKLLGMHRAVNVTLGLPTVRTSVAHGTAFDIAWRGCASAESMVEAILTATRFVGARREDRLQVSLGESRGAKT